MWHWYCFVSTDKIDHFNMVQKKKNTCALVFFPALIHFDAGMTVEHSNAIEKKICWRNTSCWSNMLYVKCEINLNFSNGNFSTFGSCTACPLGMKKIVTKLDVSFRWDNRNVNNFWNFIFTWYDVNLSSPSALDFHSTRRKKRSDINFEILSPNR